MTISERTKTNLSIGTLAIVIVFSITTAFALGVKQANIENIAMQNKEDILLHADECQQKEIEYRVFTIQVLDRLARIEENTTFLKDRIEKEEKRASTNYPLAETH